jgi:magnesium-transporting ATPase (P-type)
MSDTSRSTDYERSKAEHRAEKSPINWSIAGGMMMAIFTLIGLLIGGQVSTHDSALQLIEVMSPPLQMLAFATITATITMLALLLTMLGVIKQAELGFSKSFYELIERISLLDTILLISCASLLTVLAIPITEAETEMSD